MSKILQKYTVPPNFVAIRDNTGYKYLTNWPVHGRATSALGNTTHRPHDETRAINTEGLGATSHEAPLARCCLCLFASILSSCPLSIDTGMQTCPFASHRRGNDLTLSVRLSLCQVLLGWGRRSVAQQAAHAGVDALSSHKRLAKDPEAGPRWGVWRLGASVQFRAAELLEVLEYLGQQSCVTLSPRVAMFVHYFGIGIHL
jgi:hypothetical protein